MDYTITPAPSRSLVRRLASWTAALGLLAGGGYGVYHYAAPQFGVAPVENAVTADPGVNAETETPNARLLAAVPAGGTTRDFANPYATPSPVAADRYAAAPMLPPTSEDDEVTTPRSAAAVDAPANPFGADPMARYSGYSAPTPAVEPPPVEPTEPAAQETSVDAAVDGAAPPPVVSDIARGQEPDSVNPLRAASRSPATSRVDEAGEARAAFGRDSLPPQPTALSARPEGDAAKGTTGSPTAADTALAPLGSRYGAVAAGVEEPELADEDATAAPLTSAAATPRVYDGASPPAYVNLTPVTPPAEPPATSTAPEQFGASFATADPGITPTPGLATADGTGRPGERILEGLQSPALTIQKAAPPEIQVGKKCTFFIRVQNNSQRTVHNVVVSDEAPLGTQLVGTAPKANVSGALVQWELGTLSAGEERIVEMELLPTEEGELGSVATVTFATQASAKARCTRPQLALRLSSNPRVMIGEQQLVQIEVTNPGSGDATGVMLLESVPQGVSHEAGPALEFEVGTLRPGETRRMELMLQADEAGLIDNIMTARADANLQVQASCQFEVIAPDLKVTVDGPQKRYLERPATYTVSVDNPGTASAREVQLVTTLPPGLQFVSANNMGEYDAATHSVHWSLAELPANQRGTVEVTALPVESGDHTLQFATRAAQGLEDTTEAHVSVEGIVALTFEVQGDDGAIEVGGETAYEIRVVNQGSKAASNVQVVAVMPAGLRAQAGQGDSRYQAQGDRVVFAPLPQLAPKADATFRFRVQGLRPGDQRVTLQVTTDEVRDPIIEVESTQVYSDE